MNQQANHYQNRNVVLGQTWDKRKGINPAMTSMYSLITALLLLAIVPIIQVQIANAASIEVPKYASDPDLGMVVDGTQKQS